MKPVLIAGGGIGGLAAAISLAERGADVQIFERRDVFAEDGAGIQLGPNGTRVLEELGLAEQLKAHASAPECLFVREGTSARVLARLPLGRWLAARHGFPYWTVHRSDLHTVLAERAQNHPKIEITMGSTVTWVGEEDETQIRARTDDGKVHDVGGVICADGIWSSLRDTAFYTRPLKFSGKSAARTVIPIDQVPMSLREMAVNIWISPGAHVVHYPIKAGRELAIVVVFEEATASQDWSTPCSADDVKKRTTAFAPNLQDLLVAATDWRKWSLYSMSEMPTPAEGRTALLGDAAHPILPFLAQGGVLALEDAAVMARNFASYRDCGPAFASYAASRVARTTRVAKAAALNGRTYHLSGTLARARNEMMARLGPERMMKQYDWLYGWTPDRG